MRLIKPFAAAAVLFFPVIASADPCFPASPFTDVPAGAIYCTSTEWLKNRNITVGCTTPTTYCPNDSVTRASMALFLNRLGTALSPQVLTVAGSPGLLDLDLPIANSIVCQTVDYAVTGYPRQAIVTGTFSGLAANPLDYRNEIVYSEDGGQIWSFYHGPINRDGASGQRWTNSSISGVLVFNVGQTVRWGLLVTRTLGATVSTADFDNSRCFVTVAIHNLNGVTSPFDAVPQIREPE